MNIKEAIQATLNGEMVRGTTWDDGLYFKYDAKKALIFYDGTSFLSSDFADEEFEIYKEPKPKKAIIVEKWLVADDIGLTCTIEVLSTDVECFCSSKNVEKVKLLDTYEVEL